MHYLKLSLRNLWGIQELSPRWIIIFFNFLFADERKNLIGNVKNEAESRSAINCRFLILFHAAA